MLLKQKNPTCNFFLCGPSSHILPHLSGATITARDLLHDPWALLSLPPAHGTAQGPIRPGHTGPDRPLGLTPPHPPTSP